MNKLEQMLCFHVVQRRRWFVHNENFHIVRNDLCKLNELLLRDRAASDLHLGIQLKTDQLHNFG